MLQRLGQLRLGRPAPKNWPAARLGLRESWYAAQPVPRVSCFGLELERPVDAAALTRALMTSFWCFAEAYAGRLRAALPESYQRLGLLRFAGDLGKRAERLGLLPNARTATLEVSNLGRVEGLGGARLWFFQKNHYHGPLFNLSVATCAESGVLRATLAVPSPVVGSAEASAFVRRFERVLVRAVDRDLSLQEALEA
jgi:hypothetical protein